MFKAKQKKKKTKITNSINIRWAPTLNKKKIVSDEELKERTDNLYKTVLSNDKETEQSKSETPPIAQRWKTKVTKSYRKRQKFSARKKGKVNNDQEMAQPERNSYSGGREGKGVRNCYSGGGGLGLRIAQAQLPKSMSLTYEDTKNINGRKCNSKTHKTSHNEDPFVNSVGAFYCVTIKLCFGYLGVSQPLPRSWCNPHAKFDI